MSELEDALAKLLQNGGLEKIREFALPLLENLSKSENTNSSQEQASQSSDPSATDASVAALPAPVTPSAAEPQLSLSSSSPFGLPFDQDLFAKLRRAIDTGSLSCNKHLCLLSALRPYLNEKRAKRLDSVQGILKISSVIKAFRNM